jgi:hypothetical protein
MKGITKIKVQGLLDEKWSNWFEGMDIIHEGGNTILAGNIIDEASLHGILNLIRDLNLKLVSVDSDEKEQNHNTIISKK